MDTACSDSLRQWAPPFLFPESELIKKVRLTLFPLFEEEGFWRRPLPLSYRVPSTSASRSHHLSLFFPVVLLSRGPRGVISDRSDFQALPCAFKRLHWLEPPAAPYQFLQTLSATPCLIPYVIIVQLGPHSPAAPPPGYNLS